jgi:hypothetical protein
MRLLTTTLVKKKKQAICTTVLLESSFSRGQGTRCELSQNECCPCDEYQFELKGKSSR